MSNSKKTKATKKNTNTVTEGGVALTEKDLKHVQGQYLDYPYPFRNPEDEKTRLLKTQGEYLGQINHYLFKGKQDFKSGFRILIAGGGTGDASTYLGEQIKNNPSDTEIVYLDFSKASMEIAQKRAEIRGIKNITWINDSLLNIPNLGLGKFDYIDCSGVLHHLESPDLGLKVLSDSLKDNGGMAVMVYAQYGRTGVYQVQELMRMINSGVQDRKQEVTNGWKVVNSLPKSNWYVRGSDLLADHISHGDIGMYDMFLHKQDRAYTIPQFYEFANKAGLNVTGFIDPFVRACLNIETYLQDPELLKKIRAMDVMTQQAICELFCGSIIKHTAYLSKNPNPVAQIGDDLDNILYFYFLESARAKILEAIEQNPQLYGKLMSFSLDYEQGNKMNLQIPVLPYTKYVFKHLDSKRTLREMFDAIREDVGDNSLSDDLLIDQTQRSVRSLMDVDALLLRHKSVPFFID